MSTVAINAPVQPRLGHTLRIQERLMLYGFLLLPTFDFKGASSGGNAAQYLLLAISLASGFLFSIQRRPYPGSRPLQILIVAWWALFGFNVLTTTFAVTEGLSDATFDTYTRAILPFVLCGVSFSFVQTMVRKGCRVDEIARPMFALALVSIVFHFAYARIGLDIDTENLRYQALTPFILPSLAAFFTSTLLQKKAYPLLSILAVTTIGAILLSITRSYILVGGAMLLASLYALWCSREWSATEKTRRAILVLSALFVLSTVAVATVLVIRPNTFETWSARLFRAPTSRVDPSLLERTMNRSGIQLELEKNPYVAAFGKGFGGSYYSDFRYAPEFRRIVPRIGVAPTYTGMDSRVMNALLFTGYFGTFAQGLIYLFVYWYAFRGVRYQSSGESSRGLWASWPFITLVGLLVSLFTSDIFLFRGDSQILGIIFGLAVATGNGRFRALEPETVLRRQSTSPKKRSSPS